MKLFSQKDLFFSLITGLITGFIAWRIFVFLNIPEFQNISFVWLVIAAPLLWVLGVNLGYFLGQWLRFFNQFGKFAAVGFTNAAVYFGILNVLIYFSDINKGVWYSVFVAVAFAIGTIHSYFWNKFWVFSADRDSRLPRPGSARVPLGERMGTLSEKGGPASGGQYNKISGGEFGKFLTVSVGAGLVNVGTASVLVNFMNPLFGLTLDQWANIGGVAGSAVALVFSFIGFKLAVFKK